MNNKPVLITGGAGFIGCNIATALASRGQDVIVFDNFSRDGVKENADWLRQLHGSRVSIERGDVTIPESLVRCVHRASAVIHLAAQTAVTTSVENPREDFNNNAFGTFNVIDVVRLHNPEAPLLFASTNKVYGGSVPQLEAGISESQSIDLHSPYGCSKGAADQYVRDYARTYNMRTAVLRMSCIYGNRQFGTEDQGWVAHFMRKVMENEPVTIYGDGKQVRDVLCVDDAVDAWLRVLDTIDNVRGQIFNLGGGPKNAISLLQMLAQIEEMTEKQSRYSFADWRPGDQPWYVSDTTALTQTTGWRPLVEIRQGLARLHEWLTRRFAVAA